MSFHCAMFLMTSVPNSFKGELGQAVAGDVYKGEVVKFDKIGSSLDEMPKDIFEKLSRDQKLLYRYTKAVIFGTVPDNLKDQKPGPLCHARWLTLALSILILNTRTSKEGCQVHCSGLCSHVVQDLQAGCINHGCQAFV